MATPGLIQLAALGKISREQLKSLKRVNAASVLQRNGNSAIYAGAVQRFECGFSREAKARYTKS